MIRSIGNVRRGKPLALTAVFPVTAKVSQPPSFDSSESHIECDHHTNPLGHFFVFHSRSSLRFFFFLLFRVVLLTYLPPF